LILHSDLRTTVTGLFDFDPAQGWWFLNLGRNLVFPTEAYYHALVLGSIVMVIRKNFRAALWLTLILSLSHPFTGLQFLLILLAWCCVEMGLVKNTTIPVGFPLMLLALLVFHLTYNIILLNQFPEHRALFVQWGYDWGEGASVFFPAYALVGFFAWRSMRNWKLACELFRSPANRLFLTWFVVSFLLVHHDLLIAPRQPLHFDRGYIWAPLFLLGVGPLLGVLQGCFNLRSRLLSVAAMGGVFLMGLSDNIAWFGLHSAMALGPRWGITWLGDDGFRLSTPQRQLYAWLMSRPEPHTELLVTPDNNTPLVYLAMAYTDYRAWYSHYASTPFANQRQREIADYFHNGTIPPGWRGRTVLLILPDEGKGQDVDFSNSKVVLGTKDYVVRSIDVPKS